MVFLAYPIWVGLAALASAGLVAWSLAQSSRIDTYDNYTLPEWDFGVLKKLTDKLRGYGVLIIATTITLAKPKTRKKKRDDCDCLAACEGDKAWHKTSWDTDTGKFDESPFWLQYQLYVANLGFLNDPKNGIPFYLVVGSADNGREGAEWEEWVWAGIRWDGLWTNQDQCILIEAKGNVYSYIRSRFKEKGWVEKQQRLIQQAQKQMRAISKHQDEEQPIELKFVCLESELAQWYMDEKNAAINSFAEQQGVRISVKQISP